MSGDIKGNNTIFTLLAKSLIHRCFILVEFHFIHFSLLLKTFFRGNFIDICFKEIILEFHFFYQKLCMEDISLIDVYINGIIAFESFFFYVVLNGSDFVVDKEFFAVSISCEAPYTIVYCDDVGIEAVNEKVKGIQRRDSSAGGNVNINTESCNSVVRVIFGISVNGDMTFIKMSSDNFGDIGIFSAVAGFVYFFRKSLFGYEQGNACTLGVIVLF